MISIALRLGLFTVLICFSGFLRADLITYQFSFTDGTGNATSVSGNPVAGFSVGAFSIGNSASNITNPINGTSQSSSYAGASGGNNIGLNFKPGALDTDGSSYISLIISNNTGATQYLTDFDFGSRFTSTGPTNLSLRLGNNFSTEVAAISQTNNSVWKLVDFNFANHGVGLGSTELRLYGFGGTGTPSNINGRFDDIAVTFNVSSVPEPASFVLFAVAGGAAMGIRWTRRRWNGSNRVDASATV